MEGIENVEEENQYLESPHLYIPSGEHDIKEGDILIDAGACEGNFALKYIEILKKCYLVEPSLEWIKALEHTFAPWKDKVVFVNKYLCDENGANQISIDSMVDLNDRIDFIKMDIEGGESMALLGGLDILEKWKPRVSICTYHKQMDNRSVNFILNALGYTTTHSKGYMFFLHDKNIDYTLDFRYGMVYGHC